LVRASILLWSTASGLILGLFIEATLVGVALLFSTIVPGVAARLHYRWLAIAVTVALAGVPVVMAVLGLLEGKLKTV
jgi:voltage-gated potassium channel Kch